MAGLIPRTLTAEEHAELLPRFQGALAFIAQQFRVGIRPADVRAATEYSQRGLENAFRREFDCTPHQYILETQMQAVHDELGRGEGSVTEIARGCGIVHLGRFSVRYAERWGESPRQTLIRGRATSGTSPAP